MANEKRNPHSYKCKDRYYTSAKKKAIKEGGTLAVHIEHWVQCYSEGLEIKVNYKQSTKK